MSAPPQLPDLPQDLHYVDDTHPGITRRKLRGRFAYFDPAGERIRVEAEIERINQLAIPPAYLDVWICIDPLGHLQATGRDLRGRKQYRYHPRWTEVRDSAKSNACCVSAPACPDCAHASTSTWRNPAWGPKRSWPPSSNCSTAR
jgi:Topoisomerase IB